MTAPLIPVPLGLQPSFGFGDRTGLATPGHVAALLKAGGSILPIFAQQSIREMARTNRSPRQVMEEAQTAAAEASYHGVTGADADHLKTPEDIDRTVEAGFTFFTIDPSGFVESQADDYDEATLRTHFARVEAQIPWIAAYNGQTVTLANGTKLVLDEASVLRCGVKYGLAVNRSIELANDIRQANEKAGRDYEIELSVDETEQPTTLAEHYIIVHRCLQSGMKLVSLAPRFIGSFEKGIDYKGNLETLEKSLADHAALAETLGPYKLSLHSGSDKLSIYAAFARATKGRFHVKTAGTSYLEALRVAARHEPALFRQIITLARERYDTDKATYHVSATLAGTPPPEAILDAVELESLYLGLWSQTPAGQGFTQPGRQILHCTFGSVLTHPHFSSLLRNVLQTHADTYKQVLEEHFAHHLAALNAGL